MRVLSSRRVERRARRARWARGRSSPETGKKLKFSRRRVSHHKGRRRQSSSNRPPSPSIRPSHGSPLLSSHPSSRAREERVPPLIHERLRRREVRHERVLLLDVPQEVLVVSLDDFRLSHVHDVGVVHVKVDVRDADGRAVERGRAAVPLQHRRLLLHPRELLPERRLVDLHQRRELGHGD